MSRASVGAAIGALALFSVLAAVPAAADDRGTGGNRNTIVYPLPGTGVFPEGVDTFGPYFYVTSTATGTVFRGELRHPDSAEVFLPGGVDGRRTAVGIEATEDLLLVAGGDTGTLFVYDRSTGELVGTHAVPEGPAFLNDIAVTASGDVYVTDSPNDIVYRVDEADLEDDAPLEVFAELADFDPIGEFNANGIVSARNGRYLIVVETDTGRLFRVATRDGSIQEVDLGGAVVLGGDGLELRGNTLYVVHMTGVVTVRLQDRLTTGEVLGETTDPGFRFPTTAALAHGRLLVVNSQFDQQRPGGNPVEPFTVVSIPRP